MPENGSSRLPIRTFIPRGKTPEQPLSQASAGRSPHGAPLAALQHKADTSPDARSLSVLQKRADHVTQREGGGEGEQDAATAQETVIVSMEGGKIGSIYFGDGRIRTTHGRGPEDDRGKQRNIHRFNIDREAAAEDFKRDRKAKKTPRKKLNWYIRDRLEAGTPDWARDGEVTDPASAPENAPGGRKLLEYYDVDPVNEEDSGRRVHPSRGAAVKITRDTSDIASIKAAVALVDEDATASANNRTFFRKLLDDRAAMRAEIRMPEEVDADTAEKALKQLKRSAGIVRKALIWDLRGESDEEFDRLTTYIQTAAESGREAMRTLQQAADNARDVSYRAGSPPEVKLEIRARNAAIAAGKAEEEGQASHTTLLKDFARFWSRWVS